MHTYSLEKCNGAYIVYMLIHEKYPISMYMNKCKQNSPLYILSCKFGEIILFCFIAGIPFPCDVIHLIFPQHYAMKQQSFVIVYVHTCCSDYDLCTHKFVYTLALHTLHVIYTSYRCTVQAVCKHVYICCLCCLKTLTCILCHQLLHQSSNGDVFPFLSSFTLFSV